MGRRVGNLPKISFLLLNFYFIFLFYWCFTIAEEVILRLFVIQEHVYFLSWSARDNVNFSILYFFLYFNLETINRPRKNVSILNIRKSEVKISYLYTTVVVRLEEKKLSLILVSKRTNVELVFFSFRSQNIRRLVSSVILLL